MFKNTLLILLILFFSGCTGSSGYYILSNASEPVEHFSSQQNSIGVEKITVPEYLFKREIAVASSSHRIIFLSNAEWGEDLDDGLTRRLISYLQKSFQQPRIYAYPWGTSSQPVLKIKVNITRFIAQNNRVYLDANWIIENMRTGVKRTKLFSTSVVTKKDPESIVASMDEAFRELETSIVQALR